MVFIYTDGIYEQENQENKDFGIERIKNIVFENRVNNAQEIIIELMSNLYSFTSNKPFSDDVSCFCLKFK
jgi:sigma-B regulation protein RsbU (phosphoserine phosphatase)